MGIEFEHHPTQFVVLPAVVITQGECEEPDCTSPHYMLSVGWLIWSINVWF